MAVEFAVGGIAVTADDIRVARELAYAAWLDALKTPSKPDQLEPPDKLPDLEHFRDLAQQELTRRRGEARRPYVTDCYGQQLVYADKERQARAHQADPSPTPADYPALYGDEAEMLGLSASEMASLIMGAAERWRLASDIIEGATRVAEAGIDAAQRHEEILNILIDIDI